MHLTYWKHPQGVKSGAKNYFTISKFRLNNFVKHILNLFSVQEAVVDLESIPAVLTPTTITTTTHSPTLSTATLGPPLPSFSARATPSRAFSTCPACQTPLQATYLGAEEGEGVPTTTWTRWTTPSPLSTPTWERGWAGSTPTPPGSTCPSGHTRSTLGAAAGQALGSKKNIR